MRRAEMRRPNVPAVVKLSSGGQRWATQERRGAFSAECVCGGERGAPGMVEELFVFVGTEKARGNDNTHPFAIVLGEERRMEE